MSIIVETTYNGSNDFPVFPSADDFRVDAHGNLVLETGYCKTVAVFAAGRWMAAKFTPNRDSHGRFAKRS